MLFANVDELGRSSFLPRVCIVGTGPAGMTIAMRLAERGVPSLLVEAGGYDFSPTSQDFYRGEVIGDRYHELHQARLRQFGGTSGHWSGWVFPLDPCDFEPRSYMPNSGWPIRASDLEPYSATADQMLEVVPHLADRPMTTDVDYIQYRYSPPVRFGTKYRGLVEQSPTIGLLLNSPVLELIPNGRRIHAIKVARGAGATTDIRVDHVCVCTGGIENSRLLLWSNRRHQGQVVPHAATLGRYWMEHPVHVLADIITEHGYEMQFENATPDKWMFAPSLHAKRTFGIGGAHIWMRAHQPESSAAKELLHEAMCVAPNWSNRLLRRLGKEYHCGGYVQAEFEQFPRSDNRVELGQSADALGVPLTSLYWKKSEAERKTATVMAQLLGEAVIQKDIGRMRIRNFLTYRTDWPLEDQAGGWHHMGGTRMADSPENGVVDSHCKVFDMDNLYIGGSSVFATGGHASPTYNIVRLALRLGDRLASKLNAA